MIKYSLVLRGEPRYPERGKKVFASAQCIKVIKLEELARHITSHGCVYGVGDFMAVVSKLAEAVAEKLKEGYQVDLAELGKFFVTLGCEGVEDANLFDPDIHIKELRPHWKPSKSFKNLRRGVNFEENINRRAEHQSLMETKRSLKSS